MSPQTTFEMERGLYYVFKFFKWKVPLKRLREARELAAEMFGISE